MAFDACIMRAVISEINRDMPEAKIEKVLQPQNDEIDLLIHSRGKSKRLIFNVGPNVPRLQLSSVAKENPQKAPMFCMLLRKYFSGARIIKAEQLGFDRIAVFTVSCYDEMGFPTVKKIICEIMGKYANFIVTDGEDKILTALKIIDFAASTVRQVLPGLKYQIPIQQDKRSPLIIDKDFFDKRLAEYPPERTAEKFITSTYSGIATQIARELTYRASGRLDTPVSEIEREKFYLVFSDWQKLLINEAYTPCAVFEGGKGADYSYMDITYRGDGEKRKYESFADMLDDWFYEKDKSEKIVKRAHDILTLLNNAEARTERKLALQRESLAESERAEEYKRRGDLITSNIYLIKRGMKSFECTDYFDPECPTVNVELDTRLSPSANAQKYYKQYNKFKTAKRVLTKQITLWEAELKYLESVRAFLDKAETESDLVEIREELYRSGYASRLKNYTPKKQSAPKPMTLKTSGGYTLLVGKNNIQNEQVTFKLARSEDIWFHTKDIPGSHVLMITGADEPSDKDYTEAASIAAYYSKASGDMVAVDYTRVSNVKKVHGAKPGFVIYKTNYTAFVKPLSAKELEEKRKMNNG